MATTIEDQLGDNLGGFFKNGYKDKEVSAFKKTNLRYTENDLLKFQDPTYLGFKLFFLFDQPESGLLSTIAHPNTALAYLESRGYTQRAAYLKQFVTLLKRINSECPWFWQTIEGLDEAWKHGFNEEEFVALLGADKKITIGTLDESIDLRMTALMDLYRKACFDWSNRREVVPRNLRFFSVAIYCYEARSINRNVGLSTGVSALVDMTNGADPLTTMTKEVVKMHKLFGNDESMLDPITKDVTSINNSISRIMFDFNYCEWLPDESGVVVGSLSHSELALKAQQLVFSYRNVAEDNIYRMHSDSRVTDVFVGAMDKMAKDEPLDIAKEIAKAKLTNISKGIINNLFLGNAYGFSPINAANSILADPTNVVDVVADVLPTSSMKNKTKDVKNGNLGRSFGPNTISLKNKKKGGFPPNAEVYYPSIANGKDVDPNGNIYGPPNTLSKDVDKPIGNYENGSSSLSNATTDSSNSIGNYEDGSASLNNKDGKASGNPYLSSPSLTNDTVDKVELIDNYVSGSQSLNNGKDFNPNGNPYPGSPSLNNGKDIDPSNNVYE